MGTVARAPKDPSGISLVIEHLNRNAFWGPEEEDSKSFVHT